MGGSTETSEPLLIEYLAARFGFSALARALPGDAVDATALYVGTFVVANLVVGQSVEYARTGTVGIVENPFGLALPLGVLLAAVGIRCMTAGRANAVEKLWTHGQVGDAAPSLLRSVSLRTKLGLYLTLVAGYLAYEVTVVGVGTLLESQGPALAVFYNVFVIPLGFLPVAVEFVLVYAAVQVLLPRQLANSDLDLFFFDTRNMGGFQPIGDLLKRSYYVYTGGLLLYLAFFYGPVVVGRVEGDAAVQTGAGTAALFTVLWLIGLATLAHSIFVAHRIMSSAKARRLDEIEREFDAAVSDPHDIGSAEIVDNDEFETLQLRLGQVRETSEYPTTFTMWVQIGVSVLLPQVLQMTLQAL